MFGAPYPIKLDRLIHEIVISPHAAPWFTDVVKKACDKYGLADRVKASGMAGAPLY